MRLFKVKYGVFRTVFLLNGVVFNGVLLKKNVFGMVLMFVCLVDPKKKRR